MSKNTATFHKLPNGTFGLVDWYPNVKPGNGKAKDTEDDDDAMAEKLSREFEEEKKETEESVK